MSTNAVVKTGDIFEGGPGGGGEKEGKALKIEMAET